MSVLSLSHATYPIASIGPVVTCPDCGRTCGRSPVRCARCGRLSAMHPCAVAEAARMRAFLICEGCKS